MSKYILVSPEEIYPPYLTRTPLIRHVVREMDAATYQIAMFRFIWDPEELGTDPKWQQPINKLLLANNRMVLSEFIKKRFDRSFKERPILQDLNIKFKRSASATFKQYVKAQTTMWLAVWVVLSELQNRGSLHPAYILEAMLSESSGFLNPMFQHHSIDGKDGATNIIAKLQSENSRLRNYDPPESNPFDATRYPITSSFVNAAISLTNTDLGRQQWLAVVRARMAIVTILRTNGSFATSRDGTRITAGRPKKLDA